MPQTELNDNELQQYARQLALPDFNQQQQTRLKQSKVLIVGMGGLGCPVATYLAGAGIGTLGLVDDDIVSISNLQRQPLYAKSNLGQTKVMVAQKRLADLNPHIQINVYQQALNMANALELINGYDLVIDGTDNLATRYLINDCCIKLQKPFVFGAVYQYSGQVCLFSPNISTPQNNYCYRCLYPKGAPASILSDCNSGGVLGVLPGMIGLLQATQAVNLLAGLSQDVTKCLYQFDARAFSLKHIRFEQREQCACHEAEKLVLDGAEYIDDLDFIKPTELIKQDKNCALIDVRNAQEFKQFAIADSINISLAELNDNDLESTLYDKLFLKPDSLIILICQTDQRAQQAAQILLTQFSNIKILQGGINAWREYQAIN